MKRLVCVLMIVTLCLSVAVPCGAETTRREYDERIKAMTLEAMKKFRDFYNQYPNSFSDAYIVALYEYCNMYKAANYAYMAETCIYSIDTTDTLKLVMRGDVELGSILNNTMYKWLNGETDRQEAIDILMIMVDSVLKSQNEK